VNEIERIRQVYRSYQGVTRWRADNVGNRLIVREQARAMAKALGERWTFPPVGQFSALEIGSGGGANLARLVTLGVRPSHLFGIDLISDRIKTGREAYPDLNFLEADGAFLPFPSKSFDLVILSTVFSSIQEKKMMFNIASEVTRTLKPSGGVLWYDIRYPSLNRNVHPVTRKQLREYFPGFSVRLCSLTLLPPLARRAPYLYNIFNRIRFLHSHWFGLLTRA